MPLPNGVDPRGSIHSVCPHAGWLGNRGILHRGSGKHAVRYRAWAHKSWVTCLLHVPGLRRNLMQEGSYTELFFLDEATAFSAGHRPCGQCRRERFKAFKAAWLAANRTMLKGNVETTRDIDRALHADRTTADGQMARWEATFRELPSGAFIEHEGRPALKWKNHLLPWSPTGYGSSLPMPQVNQMVTVLTPRSIVAMYARGFEPFVHSSALPTM